MLQLHSKADLISGSSTSYTKALQWQLPLYIRSCGLCCAFVSPTATAGKGCFFSLGTAARLAGSGFCSPLLPCGDADFCPLFMLLVVTMLGSSSSRSCPLRWWLSPAFGDRGKRKTTASAESWTCLGARDGQARALVSHKHCWLGPHANPNHRIRLGIGSLGHA